MQFLYFKIKLMEGASEMRIIAKSSTSMEDSPNVPTKTNMIYHPRMKWHLGGRQMNNGLLHHLFWYYPVFAVVSEICKK